jgi:hypothetical protein
MRVFTVTCDGRPAAVVRASDRNDAIAKTLDLAEARNLLGVIAAPRRFDAREPTAPEITVLERHAVDEVILHEPIAA